jgi:hypothetical protein
VASVEGVEGVALEVVEDERPGRLERRPVAHPPVGAAAGSDDGGVVLDVGASVGAVKWGVAGGGGAACGAKPQIRPTVTSNAVTDASTATTTSRVSWRAM